jgi:hypothetical protein
MIPTKEPSNIGPTGILGGADRLRTARYCLR